MPDPVLQVIVVDRDAKGTTKAAIMHNRLAASYAGALAADLIKVTAAMDSAFEREPAAIVDRAIAIATIATNRMWESGLLIEIPDYNELV